jgi:hypothetical protein
MARLASAPPKFTAVILYSTAQIHAACDYDTENFIREVNFPVSNIKVTRMHRHTIFRKFTENNNLAAKRSPSNPTVTSSKVPPESICKIKAQNQVIQKLQVQLATTKPPTKKKRLKETQLNYRQQNKNIPASRENSKQRTRNETPPNQGQQNTKSAGRRQDNNDLKKIPALTRIPASKE